MSTIRGGWRPNECERCGARSALKHHYRWRPAYWDRAFLRRDEEPRFIPGWWIQRTYCADPVACEARQARSKEMRERRRGKWLLDGPGAPDVPMGFCRWCGEELTGENARRRNYCYADREGRPCRDHADRAETWKPRVAVRYRDFRDIGRLVCVDCGEVCEEPEPVRYNACRMNVHSEHRVLKEWEADHDLALEDGGPHTIENLFCRCKPCHRAKTARENAARRARAVA